MVRTMNKKAWLRIVEAFIAIILIMGVLFVLYSRTIEKPQKSEDIYKIESSILEEISLNKELRDAVLNDAPGFIVDFARERIPSGLNFTIMICKVEDICNLDFYKEEMYASEKVVSSTLEKYEPKKVRIFMWQEK